MKNNQINFVKNGNIESYNSHKIWSELEKMLIQNNISYSCFETEYAGHAEKITKSILDQSDAKTVIIAVGGDGTIHEVINGAAGHPNAIIGSIAAGSGNDYARGVQGTHSLSEAVKLFDEEQTTSVIDIGKMKHRGENGYFVNSLGMGFDASICKKVNNSKWKKKFQKWGIGKFIYIYYFIKELFVFKTFNLELEIDGEKKCYRRVWFAVASNQPYFGGGIQLSPHSKADDGKLQLYIVHSLSSYLFLIVFVTVFWGGHLKLHKWVENISCTKLKAIANRDLPIQVDGETFEDSEVEVQLLPHNLRVFVKEN